MHSTCVSAEDGSFPDFYQQYVKEIQEKIALNARMEFECMWSGSKQTGRPTCVISDLLSNKVGAGGGGREGVC